MLEPSLLTTSTAAAQMGIGEQTLRDWSASDATLAGCIVRQTKRSTWWSVQRLRDRGYLTKPTTNTNTNAQPAQAQAVAS